MLMRSIKTKFALISLSLAGIPLKPLRTNAHYWVFSSRAVSLPVHILLLREFIYQMHSDLVLRIGNFLSIIKHYW